jgi:hypothetical protein
VHYFKEGEQEKVNRVWMDLRAEMESARETMARLEKVVGGAGNQVTQREVSKIGYSSIALRRMSLGR